VLLNEYKICLGRIKSMQWQIEPVPADPRNGMKA
jgi:hypothetical protein